MNPTQQEFELLDFWICDKKGRLDLIALVFMMLNIIMYKIN